MKGWGEPGWGSGVSCEGSTPGPPAEAVFPPKMAEELGHSALGSQNCTQSRRSTAAHRRAPVLSQLHPRPPTPTWLPAAVPTREPGKQLHALSGCT